MFGLVSSMALALAAAPPVKQPVWVGTPTPPKPIQYYPPQAKKAGIAGRAVLECTVTAEGVLTACTAEDVYPANYGFAQAALTLAQFLRMKPVDKEGQPVAGRPIRIPVNFQLPGGPLDALSSAVTCYGAMAALADHDPSNPDAWYATRFWAVQAMGLAAQAHQRPSGVERDLAGARENAERYVSAGDERVQVGSCNRAMKTAEATQK